MNKKGMELSLTVIVLIIISIIIFIGGMSMVWKFFRSAEEIKAGIDQQTKGQIEALLREGNDIVAIPINTQQVQLGRDATYGLGIRNIRPQPTMFFIQLNLAGVFDQKGKALPYDKDAIEKAWLGNFQSYENINIAHNKYEIVPLAVRAAHGANVAKGSLVVFNVCVCTDVAETCGECTANTPVYDKVHQIFVDVR